MIISTIDLNNIENKIANPQIEGIEFITTSYDENTQITTLNASYNDLINFLTSNKLPVLKFNNGTTVGYTFIRVIYYDEHLNQYYCDEYIAPNATTNFSYQEASD